MISLVVNIVVFIVNLFINLVVLLINGIAELFGHGAVIATEKYGKSKLKKREAKAKEKVLSALNAAYGINNEYGAAERYEQNAVIVYKRIMPLSENTTAISVLGGDKDAIAMAQNVQVKYIMVELSNKERINFAIQDSDVYETVLVGDTGTLIHRGNLWVNFKRNI